MASTMDDPDQVAEQQSLADTSEEHAEYEEDEDEEYEEIPAGGHRFLLFAAVPSWLVSLVVHMILLIVLVYLEAASAQSKDAHEINVVNATEVEEVEELELMDELEPLEVQDISAVQPMVETSIEMPTEVTEVEVSTDVDAAPIQIDLVEFSEQTAPKNDLMKTIGAMTGSALEGRSAKARGQMVKAAGGSEGSEKAVAMALKWMADHQHPDGKWAFEIGPCACSHKGTLNNCYTGATALALLPFLGSGQTHLEGQYKNVVGRGLGALIRMEKPNGDLRQGGGNMYSHGLAAIALSEAYAMTQDRKLMPAAQAALNYITYAQDPVGGGWRYAPRQAGDTSVVGWQLMALKSGHLAYLNVPPNTVAGATKFLNTVQADSGAKYGYTSPGGGRATTAVGLLCRMYLGWKKDEPALTRGVEYLSGKGPSKNDYYYNYYATQVMRHYGDDFWSKWNNIMRDQVVNSQVKSGHMTGSWDVPAGGHANERGGRLYVTSMCTMILEVYYRHMPIYAKAASEEDFPL